MNICRHSHITAVRVSGTRFIILCHGCQKTWVPQAPDPTPILEEALARVEAVFLGQKLTMPASIKAAILGETK